MNAWEYLVDKSTAPAGSTAWEHLISEVPRFVVIGDIDVDIEETYLDINIEETEIDVIFEQIETEINIEEIEEL